MHWKQPIQKLSATFTLIAFLFSLPSPVFAGDPFFGPYSGYGSQTPTQSAGDTNTDSTTDPATNQNYNLESGVPDSPLSQPAKSGAAAYSSGNEYNWGWSQPRIQAQESNISDSLGNQYGISSDQYSPADETFTVMKDSSISVTALFNQGEQINYMVIKNGYTLGAMGSFTQGFLPFKYNYQMAPTDRKFEIYFYDSSWQAVLKHTTFDVMNPVAFDIHQGTPTMQSSGARFSTSIGASLSNFMLDGVNVNNQNFVGDVQVEYTVKDRNGNVVDTDSKILHKHEQHLGFNSRNFLLDANKNYTVTVKASIWDNNLTIGGPNIITIGSKEITFDLKTPPPALDFTGQDIYGYQGQQLSYIYTISDPLDYPGIYNFTVNPPAGLNVTVSADGRRITISGSPANAGDTTLQIIARDLQSNRSVTKNINVKIAKVPAITTTTLSGPKQNFSKQIDATGGFGSLTYMLDSQSLSLLTSKGLSMSSTGLITGNANTAGTFSLNVTVTDERGYQKSKTITIEILDALTISEVPAFFGLSGRNMSLPLAATGGSGGLQWSVSANDLQKLQDLSITFDAANGILRSDNLRPVNAQQTVTITINVRDSANNQFSRQITLNVAPEIQMAVTAVDLKAGEANEITLNASGGYAGFTWEAEDKTSNSFWNRYGLQITSDGKIKGTPQQAINENANIIITDAKGFKILKTLTFKTATRPVLTSTVFALDDYGNSIPDPSQSYAGFKNKFNFSVQSSVPYDWVLSVNDVAVDSGSKNSALSYEKIFDWATPGTYKVKFWATNSSGKTEVEKTITVLAAPQTQLVEKEIRFAPEGNQMKGQLSFDIRNMGELTGDAVLEIRSSSTNALITSKTIALGANASTAVFTDVFAAPGDYYYKLITTQKLGTLIVKKTDISGRADTGALISLTSPKNNDTVSGNISLTSSVTYSGGIRGVTYYFDLANGQTLSFSPANQTAPYTYNLDTKNVPNGTHTLRAVVENNFGKMTEMKITLNFKNDFNPPTVAFKNLKNNDVVAGSVNLEADATDDVAMDRVEFFVDGKSLGSDNTAPYAKTWETWSQYASLRYAEGPHEVKLVAYDKYGRSSEVKINLTVRNDQQPPVIENTIWPIGEGGTWTGLRPETATYQYVTVKARDYFGSAFKFVLQVDGASAIEKNYQPNNYGYDSLSFDVSQLSNGAHKVSYYLEDASGNKTAVQERNFNIQFIENDRQPPAVSIVSPQNGTTVKGTVKIQTNVTDDTGVARVRIYAYGNKLTSGSVVLADITAPPYEVNWDTAFYNEGSTKLMVEATDIAGRKTTIEWNVTVDNNAFDGSTPAISSVQDTGDGSSVTISYSTLNQAQRYEILISPNASFTGGGWNIQPSSNPFLHTGLTADTLYYIKIRAFDTNNNASDWSAVSTFTPRRDPFITSKPAIISTVTDLGTGSSARAQLNSLSGATGYQVQVSETADFASSLSFDAGTNLTPTLTGLKNGATLYVRYRGIKGNLYSQFSDAKTFSIADPFTQRQTVLDPVRDLGNGSIELNYTAIDGATKYEIEIFSNSSFTGTPVIKMDSTATRTTINGLQLDFQYYVRVRGVKGTVNSQWASRGFKLPPAVDEFTTRKSSISSVDDQNNGNTAKINFSALTGATSYEIEVYTNSSLTGTPLKFTAASSPATIQNLQASTPYYVRIRGLKNAVTSLWSDTANFTLNPVNNGDLSTKAAALRDVISRIPNITVNVSVYGGTARFEITRRATRFGELERLVFDYSDQGINYANAQAFFAKIQAGILPVPGQTFQLEGQRFDILVRSIPSMILRQEGTDTTILAGLWNILRGHVRVSYDGRTYDQNQGNVSYTLHDYTVYGIPGNIVSSTDRALLNGPLMAARISTTEVMTGLDLNREAEAISLALGNNYSVRYRFEAWRANGNIFYHNGSMFLRSWGYLTGLTTGSIAGPYSIKLKDASAIKKGGMQEIVWIGSEHYISNGSRGLLQVDFKGYSNDQIMTIYAQPNTPAFQTSTLVVAMKELARRKGTNNPTDIDAIKMINAITVKKIETLDNPDPATRFAWPKLYRVTFRDTDGKNYRIDSLGVNDFRIIRDYLEDAEDYRIDLQKQLDEIFGTSDAEKRLVTVNGSWNNPVFTVSVSAKINPALRTTVSYQYNMETKIKIAGTGALTATDGRLISLTGADFDLLDAGLQRGIGVSLPSYPNVMIAMLKMTNLKDLSIKNPGYMSGIYNINLEGKYYMIQKVLNEITFNPYSTSWAHLQLQALLHMMQDYYYKTFGTSGPLRFIGTVEIMNTSQRRDIYRISVLNTQTQTLLTNELTFEAVRLGDRYEGYNPLTHETASYLEFVAMHMGYGMGLYVDSSSIQLTKTRAGGRTTLSKSTSKTIFDSTYVLGRYDPVSLAAVKGYDSLSLVAMMRLDEYASATNFNFTLWEYTSAGTNERHYLFSNSRVTEDYAYTHYANYKTQLQNLVGSGFTVKITGFGGVRTVEITKSNPVAGDVKTISFTASINLQNQVVADERTLTLKMIRLGSPQTEEYLSPVLQDILLKGIALSPLSAVSFNDKLRIIAGMRRTVDYLSNSFSFNYNGRGYRTFLDTYQRRYYLQQLY